MIKQFVYVLFLLFFQQNGAAQSKPTVVAADGSGDFRTIQAAIKSLPDSAHEPRVIFIKNGVYQEKLFIEKPFVTLRGESETGVQISQSLPREEWRCDPNNKDDWGAATMNIRTHDLTLENLTVLNNYGFETTHDSLFICPADPSGKKTIHRDGHQFALRAMPPTTRLTVKNCTFRGFGGDTVSPWDVENGMYYFKNCTMEGNVDFYCPRGWAFAEGCRFICHNLNAAIWHDGTGNESAKTVLKNCTFEGDNGFKLGRFHRDAQFFLVNCQFPENMADAPIYKVRKDTVLRWETRVFFSNCHRKGGDFDWHKNNIDKAVAEKISIDWTFEGRWKPQ